jgi:uroporphyrinogen-III synthase
LLPYPDDEGMSFSHVFLTRPQAQSEELAQLLKPLGLEPVVQPAFEYVAQDARTEQAEEYSTLLAAGPGDLLLFTSPRAVMHGLKQFPAEALNRLTVCAIGPATATALAQAGIRVGIHPGRGYTSEDLLETLSGMKPAANAMARAFILAAPGGREKLAQGLSELGWQTRTIMVYRAQPAPLNKSELDKLTQAKNLLSVWTSANVMKALSQRLPPAAWFRICQGEWLVISGRLQRLARAYGPARIHLAAGPGNAAIVTTVRSLV